MRALGLLLLLLLLLLLGLVGVERVQAFQAGDRVTALFRTQHAGWRTSWTELALGKMPVFGVATATELAVELPKDKPGANAMDVKMSLMFADREFVVPWIAVRREEGQDKDRRHLQTLRFSFVRDESDVLKVDWSTVYGDQPHDETHLPATAEERAKGQKVGRKVPVVRVEYEWTRVVPEDHASSVTFLFVAACLVLLAFVCLASTDHTAELAMRRRQAQRAGSGKVSSSRYSAGAREHRKADDDDHGDDDDDDDDDDYDERKHGMRSTAPVAQAGDAAGLRARHGTAAGGGLAPPMAPPPTDIGGGGLPPTTATNMVVLTEKVDGVDNIQDAEGEEGEFLQAGQTGAGAAHQPSLVGYGGLPRPFP